MHVLDAWQGVSTHRSEVQGAAEALQPLGESSVGLLEGLGARDLIGQGGLAVALWKVP